MLGFETPLIWVPGMPPDEIDVEVNSMVERSKATTAWLNDGLSSTDFLDLLHDQGIDVFDLVDGWEAGLTHI